MICCMLGMMAENGGERDKKEYRYMRYRWNVYGLCYRIWKWTESKGVRVFRVKRDSRLLRECH
jgi:hypothetical protein